MGLRSYLRGTDILDSSESRALPRAENQYPLAAGYSGTPIRTITTSNVLAVADAYACVRVLADSIATLPLKVFRRTDAGRVPAGDEQRLVQLLRRPSPGSTSVDLISQIVTTLNVFGETFVAKWKADCEIVQLGLIHPDRVQVDLRGQRVVYTLDARTEHGPDDILHIKAMSLDGVRGMSPVAQCRTALGLNESLRESSRQFFEEGSRPSGILTVPLGSSNDAMERLAEDWRNKHGGVERMHRIAVIDGEAKFEPVAFNADDSQFLQQRELSTREVARIFRVPSWAIDGASGDSMTYANTSEQARALVTYSLRPWLVRIETALSSDPELCPGGTYAQFDLDGLLRAAPKDRADIYTAGLDPITGWLSRAEVRELHGAGRVERTGEGRKGRPYRWKIHSATANPPVAERKEEHQLELIEPLPAPEADDPEEYESPAACDADVLDILGQAARLGAEVELRPDHKLGKLDPSVWMERNGYPELERSYLCRGTFADGRPVHAQAPGQAAVLPGARSGAKRGAPSERRDRPPGVVARQIRGGGLMSALLTARAVAELLDVSAETVLRWVRSGKIPALRLPSGQIRFRDDEIDRWLIERATPRRGVLTTTAGAAQSRTVPSSVLTTTDDEET
jgi:HK97 family phage portal protein